jgi:predicted transcriptional regulator
MKKLGISQLPVVEKGKLAGSSPRSTSCGTSSRAAQDARLADRRSRRERLRDRDADTKVELLQGVLADAKVAIVTTARRSSAS